MKKTIAGLIILVLAWVNVYRFISIGSRIFSNDTMWTNITEKKSAPFQSFIKDLDTGSEAPWIKSAAPVLRWHSKELYKATDPQDLMGEATLWYREINRFLPFIDNELTEIGKFDPVKFREIKHNGFSPADDVTRLMETGGIKNGYAGYELRYNPYAKPKLPAPLFWRLGRHPLFEKVQPEGSNRLFVPIEFWYHFHYNDTRWYFGNHDGDWESVLFVFEVDLTKGIEQAIPVVVSTSAHGGSSWHCEKELSHKEGRVELFSAQGTHATYAEPGNHWRLIYPDKTDDGEAWNTWDLIRPIVKENFYGFSGSWGKTSYVYFQNAPLPPGPHFKYLPADPNISRSIQEFKEILSKCGIK